MTVEPEERPRVPAPWTAADTFACIAWLALVGGAVVFVLHRYL